MVLNTIFFLEINNKVNYNKYMEVIMNIVVTSESNKINILKKYSKEKVINRNKFYSFKELKKKIYFDYDEKAIEYVMKKMNLNIYIAKIYIENMYYLKDIDSKKVKFLRNLKEELDNNKLLKYDVSFKEYIKKKEIKVIKDSLSKEEELILKDCNYILEGVDSLEYIPKIYEAESIEEEVEFVVRKIKELLLKGVDINKIKLVVDSSYNKYLDYYFKLFKIPLNIKGDNSYLSTKVASMFLKYYDELSIEENIDKLSEDYDVSELVSIINKSVLVKDKTLRKEFIKEDLKSSKINEETYKNAVSIHELDEYYSEDDYVFLLGFNIGTYPRTYLDDDYLSDKEKEELGIDTSSKKNKEEKKNIIKMIKRIPNLMITYKLHSDNGACYKSILVEELGKEEKIEIDKRISYSKLFSELEYAKDLDKLYKYSDISNNLAMYQNNLDIKYREYNNTYFKVDKKMLKERLEEGITLSYTSLESFNECRFKYYLGRIMNLNIFEESFKTVMGSITHHILEIGINEEIDIEKEILEFIKTLDFEFGAREMFYLGKLARELEFVLNYLKDMKKTSSLNEYLFETELNKEFTYDDIKVNFTGFIDKVMIGHEKDKEVIAVVDYKTGEKSIKLDNLEYGLNIQLPIYLYLLKNSERFKDSHIAGFYLERVLGTLLNQDNKKSIEIRKRENLRLNGYTNSDERMMELVDSEYQNSQMVKGLKFTKDGNLPKSCKVLSDTEMDDITSKIEEIIKKAIKNIVEGNFEINPKIIKGKNVSCEYCHFKDICFKTKSDEVILGGDDDELDA